MSLTINIVFPHQLFEQSPILDNGHDAYIIEEYLFFKQYKFHKQKIAFHRASMKFYQEYLKGKGIKVHYIETTNELSDIRNFGKELTSKKITKICFIDPTDNWLEKRIRLAASDCEIEMYSNPLFINTKKDLSSFFRADKVSFFQTTFYKQQRKKLNVLLDKEGEPEGGKWTYDSENRKKYPKGKTPPFIEFPDSNPLWNEAAGYTQQHFKNNPGTVSKERIYPITHQESKDWLSKFLHNRFYDFGAYEDAIVKEHTFLNHSLLSPLINVGLLLPKFVLDQSLTIAVKENIPINSTEGFVRQIIGWREFIRGMYICKGSYSRTQNFWKFKRKIPASFYNGSTGIPPVDDTIKKVLKTGYCHHIERLMILGNFMLLCEFDPDEVYRWFMELFIDAYDWVMVPNIYGMSQFSDGGTFATKPYISGTNYLKKMSNYPKGEWQQIWDGLFWRFLYKQSKFFRSNHRMSLLVNLFDKMPAEKQKAHITIADKFLKKLDA